jgi:hypothetical protein
MKAFRRFFGKLSEINERYSKPRIGMSRAVRLSLVALRLYLFALVGLMIYRFVLLILER